MEGTHIGWPATTARLCGLAPQLSSPAEESWAGAVVRNKGMQNRTGRGTWTLVPRKSVLGKSPVAFIIKEGCHHC